jgi:LuxR family maltose regulon positive regulatory protein
VVPGRSQGEVHFGSVLCHVGTIVVRLLSEESDLSDGAFPVLILPAKLNRPVVDRQYVPRPQLLTRLEDGLNKRLTLISAPAGFGKTTLAAQWLDSISGHSAWLSLDKNDNEPDVFLKYVIAALRSVLPGVCEEVERLLTAPTLPPPDYLADLMVSEFGRIQDPVLLVLDDYHAITSEPVQAIVIRMLEHLPEKLHMVIISRIDPPWPLALWRVRHWLNEMRAADLRFSLEEA